MKKELISVFVMTLAATSHAAKQEMIWGDAAKLLPQFKQETPSPKHGLIKTFRNRLQNDYQLHLLHSTKNQHSRYQIRYKGIPVWGQQLIFHKGAGLKSTVTGINITDIEKDIPSIDSLLSAEQAEHKILADFHDSIKFKTISKVIFIDKQEKAHLAYHLQFYTNTKNNPISAPNYLIDANNGNILKQWNNARHIKIGQGMGGNAFALPYRSGMFQHGDALPGLPSLGKFDVQVIDGQCHVENDTVRVINLENSALDYDAFPITPFIEEKYKLAAFSYPCDALSLYLNYADGSTGPVNYAFSPVNDTMYFAQKTYDMYTKVYGVKKPLGDDLPVRAYTHLGEMDNAFAIPTVRDEDKILAHQQIVIGNGESVITAAAQAVIGHELSHNFTEVNSALLYVGQTGGINEAFSDMAAIALQDYVRKRHPWYWDGEDWTIGREAMIGGMPMRYMDDPTQDGESIGDAREYTDEMDVHHSSGVFNKAFYLLAHKPGWSIKKAFQVMVDANQHYWSPIAYFDFAACGVIQATIDRHWDKTPVVEAFDEVGVVCPMYKD